MLTKHHFLTILFMYQLTRIIMHTDAIVCQIPSVQHGKINRLVQW